MTLKELISKYGKSKINTLTKYPSILTLHSFGEKGKLTDKFTTDIQGEKMFATEKVDGTNVRIICLGGQYLIGSREVILHYGTDFYWDETMDIVNQFYELKIPTIHTETLTVIYGELYGGKTSLAKNYGKEKYGFRVFDIAEIPDLNILEQPIEKISAWRESTLDSSVNETLKYGQSFLTRSQLQEYSTLYDIVPEIPFELGDMSHRVIFYNLNKFLPQTLVGLTDTALGKPEGVVLRNENRTKIVKLRFEDYEKTLKV